MNKIELSNNLLFPKIDTLNKKIIPDIKSKCNCVFCNCTFDFSQYQCEIEEKVKSTFNILYKKNNLQEKD
jgi:hypothetical protein